MQKRHEEDMPEAVHMPGVDTIDAQIRRQKPVQNVNKPDNPDKKQ